MSKPRGENKKVSFPIYQPHPGGKHSRLWRERRRVVPSLRASLRYRVRLCFKKKEIRERGKEKRGREGQRKQGGSGNTTEIRSEKYKMGSVNSLHREVGAIKDH